MPPMPIHYSCGPAEHICLKLSFLRLHGEHSHLKVWALRNPTSLLSETLFASESCIL